MRPHISLSSDRSSLARAIHALVVLLLVAGGLTAVQLAAPAEAVVSPGTIVYIKAHNVWIAHGDGSGARRITTGGTAANPWTSPTESDSGIVVAARGNLIHRMDQYGTVLNTIDPPNLTSSAGETLGGRPTHVAVSPDGSKIAYTYAKYSCPVGMACRVRWATAFTKASALSSPSTWGVTYYDHPSWVTNSRVLVNSWLIQHIRLFDLGRGDLFWFDENAYSTDDRDLEDMELSRDGKYGAAVRDTADNSRIIWYALSGNVKDGGRPPFPTPLCQTLPAAGFHSPTIAPDSSALAWEEPDGIWIKRDVDDCTGGMALTIPGGSSPAWSSAAMRTSRPTYRFSLKARPKISGTAKKGKTLTVSTGTWSPAPASYAYRWYRNGKAIAKATKRTYKLTKKDRKRKITAKVTARRSGSPSKSVKTGALRVR